MSFIPHTPDDIAQMLAAIQISEMAQLFDEIPKNIPRTSLQNIPEGLSEHLVTRLMHSHEPQIKPGGCFVGAGAYEHHIPAAVWQITSRGEFLTAYTPYQAEASQGTLQLIYEYQTMMCELMGMEVANASLYDGASALAEAVLMALRLNRAHAKRILVPRTIHPRYRQVLRTILTYHDVILEEIPFDIATGKISAEQLLAMDLHKIAAIIIPQPNFFGILEEVDILTDFAHQNGALAIALVNPTAMALLKEPGSWGKDGADIVCGEGQPLGIPLASGGPYFGFMCTRKALVRQLPGRIVAQTHDAQGRRGFTLTLQAREQHIRRAKATSNICTNQGLLVTAATIYLSLLGPQGLHSVAAASHAKTRELQHLVTQLDGVHIRFQQPFFHEFVVQLPVAVEGVLSQLISQGIQGGYSLKQEYPELGESLLVCVTETKTEEDLIQYQKALGQAL